MMQQEASECYNMLFVSFMYLPAFRNEKLRAKLPFDDLGKLYDFAALACIIREQLRQFLFIIACNAI